MAGEGRLNGDFRRLPVTDLAHHHHVRVMAKERAQNAREIEPARGLHLDWGDTLDLILDRILDGQDLPLRRVQTRQGGIKGGRLAAAGRAGHENDAMRPVEHAQQRIEIGPANPQRFEIKRYCLTVQEAQHGRLAMETWRDGYTQIQRHAPGGDLYTP